MDRLDELKAKYQPVLQAIRERGVRLDHLHLQENKLFLQGAAPNADVKNLIWNRIKSVDPAYADLVCDLSVDPSLPQPAAPAQTAQMYEVKSGDSLWKIAERFYGRGNQFPRIIEANPDKLKDEHSIIHPGDRLKIPQAA
jgi:nucleoid-associated protein YgaU